MYMSTGSTSNTLLTYSNIGAILTPRGWEVWKANIKVRSFTFAI